MVRSTLLGVVTGALFCHNVVAQTELSIEAPAVILANVPFSVTVSANSAIADTVTLAGTTLVDGATAAPAPLIGEKITFDNLVIPASGKTTLDVKGSTVTASKEVRVIPAWLCLLPPLMAITMALVFRQVLLSLFVGVWLGAIFVYDYQIFYGLLRTLDTYLIEALADKGHISILVFSLTLGGMVGVMSRGGGSRGIVESLSKFAKTAASGQVATWLMGLLIFFDDYANTLIVGNTMRPITDRLKISREKLSYIVDSTAAPIAAIAPISTWIGYEVGLLDQSFKALNLDFDAYLAFFSAIPYSFYTIFALWMGLVIALARRDFGPMLTAERRAVYEGKVLGDNATPLADATSLEGEPASNIPSRWYNGMIPIVTVILVTMFGLYYSGAKTAGADATLKEIIGSADSYAVLTWGAFIGLFAAIILVVVQRLLSLQEAIDAAVAGYRAMLMAGLILTLAWAIGKICTDLHTADYMISLTRDIIAPSLLPLLTFLIAAAVSFATGSSWATMAIMIPIVVPLAHQLPLEHAVNAQLAGEILFATIGAILAGVIFGDHCSPISDTTVMSSMASAADHIDHVRTQLPYALTVGVVACLVGYLPAGFGWGGLSGSGIMLMALGAALLLAIVYYVGKPVIDK